MGKSVNAYDAISLAPWVSPAVQPFADASGQAGAGCSAGDVLCASVFLLANNGVRYQDSIKLDMSTHVAYTHLNLRNVRAPTKI